MANGPVCHPNQRTSDLEPSLRPSHMYVADEPMLPHQVLPALPDQLGIICHCLDGSSVELAGAPLVLSAFSPMVEEAAESNY